MDHKKNILHSDQNILHSKGFAELYDEEMVKEEFEELRILPHHWFLNVLKDYY